MAQETLVRVAETGASPYAVEITVGDFTIVGDEPVAAGGANLGPAPYDFLTIALAECTAMTMRWYAQKHAWPLVKAAVEVTHTKRDRADVFHKRVTIEGPNLTDDQRAKLLEVAEKCPVHRTLMGTPEITSEVATA
jgi:putative redox protein